MRIRSNSASLLCCLLLASASIGRAADPLPADGQRLEAPAELAPGMLDLAAGSIQTATLPNLLSGRGAPSEGMRSVLQMDGPIDPARRTAIEAAGVRLGDYLPNFAYLADLSAADLRALSALPFVRWAGVWQQAWRLDPAIGTRGFETPDRIELAASGRVVVEITLFEDVGRANLDAAALEPLRAIDGLEIVRTAPLGANEVVTAILPLAQVQRLAKIDAIQFVEEAGEITLRNNSARWVVQSNISGFTPLYTAGITGGGQVVGIMDSRVRATHCAFNDSTPIGPNHRKILAYNTSLGGSSHGTHVAGTVAGDAGSFDNNRGVAYGARFVFHLIPSFSDAAIYQRLELHHNQTARVHTNSWGDDGTTSYNGLARGFDRFQRDFEDSLAVLAVSNQSTLRNPENAKNLLAVGATQKAPSQANHCSGGVGPTADGRRKPEIYAPGCNTTSSSGTGCGTGNLTGTSMACPAIAGAALLARQYYIDGFHPTGAAVPSDGFVPTGALLKATLLNSAVDMTGIAGYPSNLEGWGRVRLDETLHLAGQQRRLEIVDVRNANGLATGQTHTHQIAVAGSGQRLKITLVFTDVAGTAGAGNPVVNDLDLLVTSPTGAVYRGNVFASGQSTTGGQRDVRNNVEQVHVNAPAVGSWTVQVVGAAVNQQRQGYALVISGDLSTCSAPAGSLDCNGNGIPDACEIAADPSLDTSGNGILDSCQRAAGDFNLDGAIDGADLAAMLALWGTNGAPAAADLNGDGIVDGADLAILLGNWGPLPL
jgi:hypothetical protein